MVQGKDQAAKVGKIAPVVLADVSPDIFGEAKKKHAAMPGAVSNDGSIPAAFAFAAPRYPLFDQLLPKRRVNIIDSVQMSVSELIYPVLPPHQRLNIQWYM